MRFRALVLVGGLLLLLTPAAAVAQSAGDKQYSDPFAGKSPPASSPSKPSSGSGSTSVPQGTPKVSSPSQLASSSSPTASSSGSSSSSSNGTLARTGFRAWMLAAMGALMLVGGLLLRLGLRPLPKRPIAALPGTVGRDVRLRRRARR